MNRWSRSGSWIRKHGGGSTEGSGVQGQGCFSRNACGDDSSIKSSVGRAIVISIQQRMSCGSCIASQEDRGACAAIADLNRWGLELGRCAGPDLDRNERAQLEESG